MAWIKITHTTGQSYLNSDQIAIIEKTGITSIDVYSFTSVYSYSFSSSTETDEIIAKLNIILKAIDINSLPNQISE